MLWPIEPLVIFLFGTFIAAFITGAVGFAFGLIAAAIWLHALAPVEATTLVVAYGLLVQSYAVWKLRNRLDFNRLLPLVAGSAAGVIAGILLLQWLPSTTLRVGIGALLVLFTLYSLMQFKLPDASALGRPGDIGAGFLNGAVGGATGLAGIVVVIWASLRGWTKDEQRAIFQPVGVATFLMTLIALGGSGLVTANAAQLFLFGLPALALGTWAGWQIYGKTNEARFRQAVLILLLLSGLALIAKA